VRSDGQWNGKITMKPHLPVVGTTAASTAFCTERLAGPNGTHLFIDGNGKITRANGSLANPKPNAFSLVQIETCPGSTAACQKACYVHGLEKHQNVVWQMYRHNTDEIQKILADEFLYHEWAGIMAWAVAQANARFLLTQMRESNRMRRSYKDGRAPLAGYLEDQAAVADGLLSLYEATFDAGWLEDVYGLVTEMLSAFWDDATAAFFDSATDQERLVARPQDVTDNAVPSGTSMANSSYGSVRSPLGPSRVITRGRDTWNSLMSWSCLGSMLPSGSVPATIWARMASATISAMLGWVN